MNVSRALAATTIACAAAIGIGGALAQNQSAAPRYPIVLSEMTAPGIDRGVRDLDRPRRRGTAARGATAGREPFVRGSLIVKFRPGTTPEAERAMLAQIDGTAGAELPYANFDIVSIVESADPEGVARRLGAQPDVEYAQARYRVLPRFVPNDPEYSRQWNYPALDMERAWDINPGATASVIVAVLDSGVAFRSGLMRYNARPFQPLWFEPPLPALGPVDIPFAAAPDLGGPDRFVAPRDFIWNTAMPFDLDGHGTHVAGTIGQLTNNAVGAAGMAFNVRIMPVKVVSTAWDDIFLSPFEGTDDVVARGIRYAADNGAQVVNMSIGRTGSLAPAVRDAIAYAVSRNTFVVVAGGNDFENDNPTERFAEIAPQIDGVVSVAAIGRDRRRAPYSGTGSYVELAAPGGNVLAGGTSGAILQQTFDFDFVDTYFDGPARYRAPRFDVFAYQYLQGTSMAAPHVSGLAALLIQQGISNPAAIEAIMRRYAIDLGFPGRDDEYGHGLINPRASLRGLGLAR